MAKMKRTPTKAEQAAKRRKTKNRKGFDNVARTRGAATTGEMKYFDADYQSTALTIVTTTWPAGTSVDPLTTLNLGSAAVANPLALCVPTVGAGLNQRVGRKITIHKVKIHGTIIVPTQAAQAAADNSSKVRVILVLDQQTNAGQMTGAQLLRDGTAANTTIQSFQNPDNFGRFRVLKDKMLQVGNINLANTGAVDLFVQSGMRVNFKFAVNFKKPIVVHFNNTNGGTVADIVDNSLHMVAGVDNTALAPNLAYYSRVCYKDV